MSSKFYSLLMLLFLLITTVLPIIQGLTLYVNEDKRHDINTTLEIISDDLQFPFTPSKRMLTPFHFAYHEINPLQNDLYLFESDHKVNKRKKREIRIRNYENDILFNRTGITQSEINEIVKAEFDRCIEGVNMNLFFTEEFLVGQNFLTRARPLIVCKHLYFDIHENYPNDNYLKKTAERTSSASQISYYDEEIKRIASLGPEEKLKYFLRKAIWCELQELKLAEDYGKKNTEVIEKLMKNWKFLLYKDDKKTMRNNILKFNLRSRIPGLTREMLKSVSSFFFKY